MVELSRLARNWAFCLITAIACIIAWRVAGAKLGNAGPPPEIIFRGPLKFFSWMVMQKSEPRRGDAKLRGSGGACPPRKFFLIFTLFWKLFVRLEPLKLLSFDKV